MKIMLLRHYIKRAHLVPEVLPDGLPLLLLLLVLHPPLPVGDHDGLLPDNGSGDRQEHHHQYTIAT